MSDYPTPDTPVKITGLREICQVNGRYFRRRRGKQQWTEYTLSNECLPPELEPLYLSLVHEDQGPGQPRHWYLFVARENQPGWVYQVTGDAEHMTYVPSSDLVDPLNSESSSNLYQLAVVTEQQAVVVKEVADNEPPPQAPDRRSVRENCQGWAVRVIAKLVERGIVSSGKLQMAISMMQPV